VWIHFSKKIPLYSILQDFLYFAIPFAGGLVRLWCSRILPHLFSSVREPHSHPMMVHAVSRPGACDCVESCSFSRALLISLCVICQDMGRRFGEALPDSGQKVPVFLSFWAVRPHFSFSKAFLLRFPTLNPALPPPPKAGVADSIPFPPQKSAHFMRVSGCLYLRFWSREGVC